MPTRPPTPELELFMFRQFLRDRRIASVKATSHYLVRRICRRIGRTRPRVVVEFGPGLGCFTRALLDRLPAESTLVLIESNPEFAARLGMLRDPRLRVVLGNACEVRTILYRAGLATADVVLSGIPFSYFPETQTLQLLREIRSLLSPDGVFVAYQATARLQKPLKRVFGRVRVERELFHIPPLAVLEARAA